MVTATQTPPTRSAEHFAPKPLWNAIAIAYTLISYGAGIGLMISSNGWLNLFGVGLTTHGMVLSAYLAHEFTHGTIFKGMRWNRWGGEVMQWLNGACYARFRDMSVFHIAHHLDKVDHSSFDLSAFLNRIPKPLRWLILALEWMYFPALFFVVQARGVTAPFWQEQRRDERLRVILTLVIRLGLFGLLAWISPKALLLYFLCYLGLITIVRLMDAFQHTYELIRPGEMVPAHDLDYEQTNTFTTLFSTRFWWINLLILNFGYHNAHHHQMRRPWHSLYPLHEDLSRDRTVHIIGLPQMLSSYHRFRLKRIFAGEGEALDAQGQLTMDEFYGIVGGTSILIPAVYPGKA